MTSAGVPGVRVPSTVTLVRVSATAGSGVLAACVASIVGIVVAVGTSTAATEDLEARVGEGGTSASSRETETPQHLSSEHARTDMRTETIGRTEEAGTLGRSGVDGCALDETHPLRADAAVRTDDKRSHATEVEVTLLEETDRPTSVAAEVAVELA